MAMIQRTTPKDEFLTGPDNFVDWRHGFRADATTIRIYKLCTGAEVILQKPIRPIRPRFAIGQTRAKVNAAARRRQELMNDYRLDLEDYNLDLDDYRFDSAAYDAQQRRVEYALSFLAARITPSLRDGIEVYKEPKAAKEEQFMEFHSLLLAFKVGIKECAANPRKSKYF